MKTDCKFKITIQLEKPIEQDNGNWLTHINIPCGKCGRCISRRKMEWSFRMTNEMIHSKTSYFVTLTYSPENVPYNKYGRKTLIPTRAIDIKIKKEAEGKKRTSKTWIDRSLQGFFKRLRQNHKRAGTTIETLSHNLSTKDKIKYYACGEYGEERGRPHYHAIIFNTSAQAIEKSWNMGGIHIAPATEETIGYVMKYLDKKIGEEQDPLKEPEFSTMSEGIGNNYITKNKQWHKRNIDILYVTTSTGIKVPMPKYFRDKIFTDEERKDQVIIVTEKLEEIRQEEIKELGYDQHAKKERDTKKESERRFKKKIKKRIVD